VRMFNAARSQLAASRIEVGYDPVFGDEEIRFRPEKP